MAMTADGEATDGVSGSSALIVRIAEEEQVNGDIAGSIDWSGTTNDLAVSMQVNSEGSEEFYMAMTADGEATDGVSGSSALIVRIAEEEQVNGDIAGSIDWSGTTNDLAV